MAETEIQARALLAARMREDAQFLIRFRSSVLSNGNRRKLEGCITDLQQGANEIESLVGIPSTRTYTAHEIAVYFMSGEYDHLTAKEFREKFPMSEAELARLFGADR